MESWTSFSGAVAVPVAVAVCRQAQLDAHTSRCVPRLGALLAGRCACFCKWFTQCPQCDVGWLLQGLQGSTAMACRIVVLTGTSEMNTEDVKHSLPAAFRRAIM